MLVWPLYFFINGSWPRHSPATTILLVVVSVSHPSRVLIWLSSSMPSLTSFARNASRIASEIWSQTLSGWPSETDSLVNRKFLRDTDWLLEKADPGLGQRAPGATDAFLAASRHAVKTWA